MTDRRRINGPPGGTTPPVFTSSLLSSSDGPAIRRPVRSRKANELRKIFLKTGLTPPASGSAYLELEPSSTTKLPNSILPLFSSLKLTCTVHGPKPLPRSTPYSPNLLLSTHVKFAPFAARQRRGYILDADERDLAVHLETALKGVIIAERWPKSGVDVIVTVLEGEENWWWGDVPSGFNAAMGGAGGWGMMSILAGCITVASAAIADARVDCLDLVTGGVAAIVGKRDWKEKKRDNAREDKEPTLEGGQRLVLDPCPSEHSDLVAGCVVGYMASRDEITELWLKGDLPRLPQGNDGNGLSVEELMGGAVDAARAAQLVLAEAVRESAELVAKRTSSNNAAASLEGKKADNDVDMGM